MTAREAKRQADGISWFLFCGTLAGAVVLTSTLLMAWVGTDDSAHFPEQFPDQLIRALAGANLTFGIAMLALLFRAPYEARQVLERRRCDTATFGAVALLLLGVPPLYISGMFGGTWAAINVGAELLVSLVALSWLAHRAFFSWE